MEGFNQRCVCFSPNIALLKVKIKSICCDKAHCCPWGVLSYQKSAFFPLHTATQRSFQVKLTKGRTNAYRQLIFRPLWSSIHPFLPLYPYRGHGVGPIPAILGDRLDRSPGYCRETQKNGQPFMVNEDAHKSLWIMVNPSFKLCLILSATKKEKNIWSTLKSAALTIVRGWQEGGFVYMVLFANIAWQMSFWLFSQLINDATRKDINAIIWVSSLQTPTFLDKMFWKKNDKTKHLLVDYLDNSLSEAFFPTYCRRAAFENTGNPLNKWRRAMNCHVKGH